MDISSQPLCFSKWISQSANKCEQCAIQLECYSKMREIEKKQEKLEALKVILVHRQRSTADKETNHGACEKCS